MLQTATRPEMARMEIDATFTLGLVVPQEQPAVTQVITPIPTACGTKLEKLPGTLELDMKSQPRVTLPMMLPSKDGIKAQDIVLS